jgi:hypothetical protein
VRKNQIMPCAAIVRLMAAASAHGRPAGSRNRFSAQFVERLVVEEPARLSASCASQASLDSYPA